MEIKITILVENYAHNARLAEWGLATLIELDKSSFLFDCGLTGSNLLLNLHYLKKDLSKIHTVALSHGHFDHTDGLREILKIVPIRKLFAHPDIFTERYSQKNNEYIYTGMKLSKDELEKKFNLELMLYREMTHISDNLFMTGEIPITNCGEPISKHFVIKDDNRYLSDSFSDDNSLVIDSKDGLIVILGCAHRGLVNILSYVKRYFNKPIYAVIGGMHLHDANEDHFQFVVDYFKSEDIKIIAPNHCTGIDKIFRLKNIFRDKIVNAFAGDQLIF